MTIPGPTSPAAFENRYRQQPDPWSFATSAYEQSRYRTVISSLVLPRYARIYEPGCSVGVLTEQLARVADWVIATDIAQTAVERAQQRCAHLPNVELHVADVRTFDPVGPLDLIVFSEIGYYFDRLELARIGHALSRHLAIGGHFIAVHWLGHSADHVLHGDVVHGQFLKTLPLAWEHGRRYEGFRLDVWHRR